MINAINNNDIDGYLCDFTQKKLPNGSLFDDSA